MQVETKRRKVWELSKYKDHMWGEKPPHIYMLSSKMMDINFLCNSNIIIFFIPAEAWCLSKRRQCRENKKNKRKKKEEKREERGRSRESEVLLCVHLVMWQRHVIKCVLQGGSGNYRWSATLPHTHTLYTLYTGLKGLLYWHRHTMVTSTSPALSLSLQISYHINITGCS